MTPAPIRAALGRRSAALAILLAAAATIGTALVFEHGFGLRRCKLCLWQRMPYYAALPVALAAALVPERSRWSRIGLWLLAAVFLGSAALGVYHAGVEWGIWAGPSDCGGAIVPPAATMNAFRRSLEQTRVVSCTQAAWRFLGLSLAGWNAVISLVLVLVALTSAWPMARLRPARTG